MGISGTDKTDNRTCEIIYDNFTSEIIAFQPITVLLFLFTVGKISLVCKLYFSCFVFSLAVNWLYFLRSVSLNSQNF